MGWKSRERVGKKWLRIDRQKRELKGRSTVILEDGVRTQEENNSFKRTESQ